MARLPRFDMPGVAQHIVQRGNGRLPCFAAELDYIRYLQDLRDVAQENDCAIHAYVLMTNHVHLLATPCKTGAISSMMQALVGYLASMDTPDNGFCQVLKAELEKYQVNQVSLLSCRPYVPDRL